MSVFAYVGFPGSGKSYSVVENQILPALRAGRTVVTNMPMKSDLVRAEIKTASGGEVDLRAFDINRALQDPNTILEDCPAGCVWVVDEVYKLFPAGVSVADVPDPFKQILAEHRHRVDANGNAMQVVLVCQDLAQIARFARQLVETTFRTTKLTALGLHKRFRVDVFNGPVSGPNPPIASRLREMAGKYDKSVFRYYISHTLSESGKEGANELAIDKRANVLRRPIMIALPFIIVGLTWFGVRQLGGEAERFGLAKKAPPQGPVFGMSTFAKPAAPGPIEVGRPVLLGNAPIQQEHWFVKGSVVNLDNPAASLVLLEDLNTRRRVTRPYESCLRPVGESMRCPFEGGWVSELGVVGEKPPSGFSLPLASSSP